MTKQRVKSPRGRKKSGESISPLELWTDIPELAELQKALEVGGELTEEELNRRRELTRSVFRKSCRGGPSIHDKYFLLNMARRSFMIEVLETYLADWKEELDIPRFRYVSTARVNRMFDKKIADIMIAIPAKAPGWKDVEILIVIEHKAQSGSKENRRTIANLIQYITLASVEGLDEDSDGKRRFPQALAIVFYTGDDPEFDTPRWSDYFELPEGLSKYLVRCEIPCVNVTRLMIEDKIQGSPFVQAAFWALASAGKRTLVENFRKILRVFAKIKNFDGDARIAFNAFIDYAFQAVASVGQKISRKLFYDALQELEDEEMKEELSVYDGWISEEERDECLEKGGLIMLMGLVNNKLITQKQAAEQAKMTVAEFKKKTKALVA
ncbi:MAG: hypothetical protein IJM30_13295 [Thermoguttaceae bacterium]|nr:hypothetical protein [Thermoguttaceae bacterium]